MKNSLLKSIVLAAVCAGGSLSLMSGCAGTATTQSTGEYVDDAALTAKVKAALVKDETVKALDVNVETFKARVQLSGFVDNAAQKTRAGQVAAGVVGVREVKNDLSVK